MRQWIGSTMVQIIAYLNKCWVIVNWTLKNTLQWNINQNIKLYIHENAPEVIVCKMAAILSRRKYVKYTVDRDVGCLVACQLHADWYHRCVNHSVFVGTHPLSIWEPVIQQGGEIMQNTRRQPKHTILLTGATFINVECKFGLKKSTYNSV